MTCCSGCRTTQTRPASTCGREFPPAPPRAVVRARRSNPSDRRSGTPRGMGNDAARKSNARKLSTCKNRSRSRPQRSPRLQTNSLEHRLDHPHAAAAGVVKATTCRRSRYGAAKNRSSIYFRWNRCFLRYRVDRVPRDQLSLAHARPTHHLPSSPARPFPVASIGGLPLLRHSQCHDGRRVLEREEWLEALAARHLDALPVDPRPPSERKGAHGASQYRR